MQFTTKTNEIRNDTHQCTFVAAYLSKASVDRGIPSVIIPNDMLSNLIPIIHNWMPLP